MNISGGVPRGQAASGLHRLRTKLGDARCLDNANVEIRHEPECAPAFVRGRRQHDGAAVGDRDGTSGHDAVERVEVVPREAAIDALADALGPPSAAAKSAPGLCFLSGAAWLLRPVARPRIVSTVSILTMATLAIAVAVRPERAAARRVSRPSRHRVVQ